MQPEQKFRAAADAIAAADALVIGAGAGMGVDSGLPDFRGPEGFWRAYPPFRALGLNFTDLANPHWFEADPALAWGFYGHRLKLYRETVPHKGFTLLKQFGEACRDGAFVFTSNVDGQFSKAGFEAPQITECHGAIGHLQCSVPCRNAIWEAPAEAVNIDPDSFRASGELPLCPYCGAIARPNILMFGDGNWISDRSDRQSANFNRWLQRRDPDWRLVKIEIGAGSDVPSVRWQLQQLPGQLIRINPREWQTGPGDIGIAGGALKILNRVAEQLR